ASGGSGCAGGAPATRERIMRVAIVTPELGQGPWEGLMYGRVRELAAVVRARGGEAFEISQQTFRDDPRGSLRRLLDFAPTLLTGPNFNYLLLAAIGNPEVLDLPVPTLAYWDDPLGALFNYTTYPQTEGVWKENFLSRHWRLVRGLLSGPNARAAPAIF